MGSSPIALTKQFPGCFWKLSELQKLQEFLNSEVEKVQREIESALAGITIIVETIAPWKSTTVSEVAAHPIITRTVQRSPFAASPSSNRI
jgi:hypothetical protein